MGNKIPTRLKYPQFILSINKDNGIISLWDDADVRDRGAPDEIHLNLPLATEQVEMINSVWDAHYRDDSFRRNMVN